MLLRASKSVTVTGRRGQMGRRIVGLVRGTGDSRERKNRLAAESCRQYATAHGWNDIEVITVETGEALLMGSEPGHILSSFPSGTVVIIPAFSHLADSASDLRAGVPKIIGAGIDLHVAKLGPVGEHLPAVMTAWRHAEPLERDLAAERQARRAEREEMVSLFSSFQQSFVADMVRKWGVPASGLPALNIPAEVQQAFPVEEPKPNGKATDWTPLGKLLQLRRQERGWAQKHVAQQLGRDPSAISRAESSGEGPHIMPMLQLLAPELIADLDELDGIIEPLILALHRAKAQLVQAEQAMLADGLASVKAEQDRELARLEGQAHIINEAAREAGDEATA
jgi:transcriptional regulator with XRE-family HTH domain